MSEALRAVLWDMDGTLVDSSDYHFRSWRDTLAGEGLALDYASFIRTFGQRNDTILRTLLRPDLPDAEIARIGGAKEKLYRAMVRGEGIVLLPGAEHWLRTLHAAAWRQAVASSAPRANIETILEVLGLGELFAALVSAEDVQHGKPDPQVFLLGAGRLAVPPARCVVVEDAPAGLEGARRAGMRCIGVRSSHGALTADIVVDRLDQLPPTSFERLLDEG